MSERSLPLSGRNAKEPPPGGSFCGCLPPGGGFKRRGPKPPPLSLQGDRILKERGKFEIPLSLSGVLWLLSIDMERQLTPQIFDLAGGSYAQLSSLRPQAQHPSCRRQKRSTRLAGSIYIPRGSGRVIYLSPAAAGDIYFVRAVRRGLIKHKKRKAQWASKLYYTSRGSGRYIFIPRGSGGYLFCPRRQARAN